jgi:hypothetical protein
MGCANALNFTGHIPQSCAAKKKADGKISDYFKQPFLKRGSLIDALRFVLKRVLWDKKATNCRF